MVNKNCNLFDTKTNRFCEQHQLYKHIKEKKKLMQTDAEILITNRILPHKLHKHAMCTNENDCSNVFKTTKSSVRSLVISPPTNHRQ